jgi:hypothetical protein
MKPIRLIQTIYSHPSTGRSETFYTLMVDDEPLHLDTRINPEANQYAWVLADSVDLLSVLEDLVSSIDCAVEFNLPINEAVLVRAEKARAAIKRAKGGDK